MNYFTAELGTWKSEVLLVFGVGDKHQEETRHLNVYIFKIKRHPYLNKTFTEHCLHPSHQPSSESPGVNTIPFTVKGNVRGTLHKLINQFSSFLPNNIILTKQKSTRPYTQQIRFTLTFFTSKR